MQLVKEYTLEFPVETLFEAWLSNDMLIAPITKISIDARVGGDFILHSGDARMLGKILEIKENERIKYTWHWEGSEEETIIDVTFENLENACSVKVEQSGFLSIESRDMHKSGWDHYISSLIKLL